MKMASNWTLRLGEADVAAHFRVLAKFHAELLDEIGFADRFCQRAFCKRRCRKC